MRLIVRGACTIGVGAILMAGLKPIPVPLSHYAGKYPFDRVGGYRLIDHPTVKTAVEAAVYNSTVRHQIKQDGTAGTISYANNIVYASECEQHNCNGLNWAYAISNNTKKAAVCYFNDELTDKTSRWFMDGFLVYKNSSDCGSDLVKIPKAVLDELQRFPPLR